MKPYTSIYLRTSTNHQSSGISSQKLAVIDYCKRNGFSNTQTYIDEGISGSKSSRPAFDLMIKDAKEGLTDCIVTYSLSRAARNVKNLLETLELLQELDVRFISISESIDSTNNMSKILVTILGAVAEFELDLIKSRICAGLNNAKSNGVILGRKKTRNSELIQELASKNYTYREIAKLAKCSVGTVHRELKGGVQ
jgi:DNA invertase Pin-like site-specific DNA recombinase